MKVRFVQRRYPIDWIEGAYETAQKKKKKKKNPVPIVKKQKKKKKKNKREKLLCDLYHLLFSTLS